MKKTFFVAVVMMFIMTGMAQAKYGSGYFRTLTERPAGVSFQTQICVTEFTEESAYFYFVEYYTGGSCGKVSGIAVSGVKKYIKYLNADNSGFVYFASSGNSNHDQTTSAVRVLGEDHYNLSEGQKQMQTAQAVMACENRVDNYNRMAAARAEAKYNECIWKTNGVIDVGRIVMMNENDTGGMPASAKDQLEERLVKTVADEAICGKKQNARLINPATCQSNPNYNPPPLF